MYVVMWSSDVFNYIIYLYVCCHVEYIVMCSIIFIYMYVVMWSSDVFNYIYRESQHILRTALPFLVRQ